MGLPFPKLKVAGSTPVSRSITSTRGLSGMWKEDRRRPDSPASDSDRLPIPDLDVPDGVTSLGRTLVVKGELTAGEHLIIEGQFEGHLAVPEHGLAVGKHAAVSADILAKTVTVLGRAKGTFTASDKMEIRASGFVEGAHRGHESRHRRGCLLQGVDRPDTDRGGARRRPASPQAARRGRL